MIAVVEDEKELCESLKMLLTEKRSCKRCCNQTKKGIHAC